MQRADAQGLSGAQAAESLREFGTNEVQREPGIAPIRLLLAQFKSPLIALLAGACIVSAAMGEVANAIAIFAIVIINGVVGFVQEYRAGRSLQALRALTAPHARVLRDGRITEVLAAEVVPRDVLVLESGDVVSADSELIEANALLANEASLTGESAPVEKTTAAVAANAPLAERHNALFMGTSIAGGTGRARVTATGMSTELGKIARLIATATEQPTPLQQRLSFVSRMLLFVCLGIVTLVAGLGLLHGQPPLDTLLSAVSLAVAAVPESLPAVVTIALAVGVQRMVARHVLVRRLPAVETLGCASVICTDKTGTLTTGVMRVREIWGEDRVRVLDAAAACCDAEIDANKQTGSGDPTEVALLLSAAEHDISRSRIESERPRLRVHPFDAERKRMSILRADGVLYVKGALESVLPLCVAGAAGVVQAHAEMAARGLRVLAVACGTHEREEQLELLGLAGIADPPRSEAIQAIAAARDAGIRTIMITGDHIDTAHAIARELGILDADDDPDAFVHARATPESKLMIVRDWKSRGEVVAMTGDGVNDAPALREAHIGIAMGKTGTDVTREAADIVLADDNFASIVAAVREGRGIFDNIRKTLVYLLAGNASELCVMLGAALLGLPLPLLPLHLLWINLVTDGLPALALVMDPAGTDAMQRPPRPQGEAMLGAAEWLRIGLTGLLEGGISLGVFWWTFEHRGLAEARSLTFAVLVLAELLRAFAARSPTRLFWEVGAFTNPRLLLVVAVQVAVQLGIHELPVTRALFQIRALSVTEASIALLLGLLPVSILELSKLLLRLRARPSSA